VLREDAGRLTPTYDFQTPADKPIQFISETTYTSDPTIMTNQVCLQWIHSLSAVISAQMGASLNVWMIHEHEVLPWQGLKCLAEATEGSWRHWISRNPLVILIAS
jgi:hypothetical protein